jgi:hypothetical protein
LVPGSRSSAVAAEYPDSVFVPIFSPTEWSSLAVSTTGRYSEPRQLTGRLITSLALLVCTSLTTVPPSKITALVPEKVTGPVARYVVSPLNVNAPEYPDERVA